MNTEILTLRASVKNASAAIAAAQASVKGGGPADVTDLQRRCDDLAAEKARLETSLASEVRLERKDFLPDLIALTEIGSRAVVARSRRSQDQPCASRS